MIEESQSFLRGYNGNQNLKRIGQEIEFSREGVSELVKCAEDPIYFITHYCYIVSLDRGTVLFELFDYQKRFIREMHANNRVLSMMPRQSGKTQVVAAYILWYTIFNDSKTVAILANKSSAAREIMDRYQFMYEGLPLWLQQGIKVWNKGSIELENKSKVFTAATTASGIRGKSCVTGDTKICVLRNNGVYYLEISKTLNDSVFIHVNDYMKNYTVYRTTNNINGKTYIGFHSISIQYPPKRYSGNGSIFYDGYLGSGKLIKSAVEKYGPENFSQELLGIFQTKEEAELLESELVNRDYTQLNSNYNIALGGNVRICVGVNNGFYGKTHSQETLDKIQESRTNGGKPLSPIKIKHLNGPETFYSYEEVCNFFGYNKLVEKISKRLFVFKLCYENIIEISIHDVQKNAIDSWKKRLVFYDTAEDRKRIKSKIASERFIGGSQTIEQVNARVLGHKKWVDDNTEAHAERMNKINKNPDKIKKTAEKHRGMKRSQETCKNISESLKGKPAPNKGTKMIYELSSPENTKNIDPFEDLPAGWAYGNPLTKGKKKGIKYNNGKICKIFSEECIVPQGWKKGMVPR